VATASASLNAQPNASSPTWSEAGYVKTIRVGRRNHYTVDHEHAMRHTAQIGHEIGVLLAALSANTLDDSNSNTRLNPNA
jgi:hypothetical protein